MNIVLSVVGLIGGLLCAVADLLLDLKGKDNKKIGKSKFVDSKWEVMSEWRFRASIFVAMFAVPMYTMGVISLANQIELKNAVLSQWLRLAIFVGAMGGFFIHSHICLTPIVYKRIMKEDKFELADSVSRLMFDAIKIPFSILYLILMFGPTLIIGYSIVTGILEVPMWCLLFNPVVFQIIGWIFRAIKRDWFCDAPACCAASLGLASFGIVGLMNLM